MNNQDNKYYTPTIEEFHVGFEFNINDTIRDGSGRKEWSYNVKFSVAIASYIKFLLDKNPEDVRVKYLDKEDIESLGWINGETRGLSSYIMKTKDNDFQMYLHDWLNEKGYWFIEIYDYSAEYVFRGNIKNKSELIKLMKQLQIS